MNLCQPHTLASKDSERNRLLYVLKVKRHASPHSGPGTCAFKKGIELLDVIGTQAMLRDTTNHLASCPKVEIIDLVQHPDRARNDNVLAIPTVVRVCPLPIKRLVGDLSNIETALKALGLSS
jgi:hypothetical protein